MELGLRERSKLVDEGHDCMVASPSLASGAASVLLVAAVLAGGASDPGYQREANALIASRAEAADGALGELVSVLRSALEHARSASGRLLQGEELPGEPLEQAASELERARATADGAREAVNALGAALNAADPSAAPLGDAPGGPELAEIAAQLRSAAEAADLFAEMRIRTQSLLAALDGALAALEAGETGMARQQVAAAREDHAALTGWEIGSQALPVWLVTTDAMIGAVERLTDATERGDTQAIDEARIQLGSAAADAAYADRALSIALSEGAPLVIAGPIARLGAMIDDAGRLRDAAATLRVAAQGGEAR